jgi:hypothetical protein
MANSIQKNPNGPLWPLGFIAVVTPGTPVSFMSLVDPTNDNAPDAPTSTTSAEYTPRCQEFIITAQKPGAAHGTQLNTGNVYILIAPTPTGSGNRDDMGSLILPMVPGAVFFLSSAFINLNVWSPYKLLVDADNAGDGVLVTMVIQ